MTFEWAFKVHLKMAFRIVARYKLSTLPDLDQLYTEKTTINNDIIIGPTDLKAVTNALTLKVEKWQEQFLKPTRETKHDGTSQL